MECYLFQIINQNCMKYLHTRISLQLIKIKKTLLIFKRKVVFRNLDKNCSAQLNFGLSKTSGDWILFIDADEVISNKLSNEILNSIRLIGYSGFYIRRKDLMWNKWLRGGETAFFKDIRLVKRRSGKWKRRVHQKFEIIGKTGILKNPILHYPHPKVKDF